MSSDLEHWVLGNEVLEGTKREYKEGNKDEGRFEGLT